MFLKQQLRTTNDSNGNPRRVWVLYSVEPGDSYGGVVSSIDEGYSGEPQFGEWGEATQLRSIDVPVSEYKRFLRRDSRIG